MSDATGSTPCATREDADGHSDGSGNQEITPTHDTDDEHWWLADTVLVAEPGSDRDEDAGDQEQRGRTHRPV